MSEPHLPKVSRWTLAVNFWLAVGAACSPPRTPDMVIPADVAGLRGPFGRANTRLQPLRTLVDPADLRPAGRLGAVSAAIPPPAGDATVLDQLTSPVTGASLDEDLGADLTAALDEAEAEGRPVSRYGVGALSLEELVGDDFHDGLCDLPQLTYSADQDGQTWQITLGLAELENFVGSMDVVESTMPADCVSALLAAGGDVDAALASGDCVDLEIAMFLPEGSDCRSCVEGNGGDLAACNTSGDCERKAPAVAAVGNTYWNQASTTLLACAPDYTIPALALGIFDADGTMPEPFDIENWGYLCAPFWSESAGAVTYSCTGGDSVAEDGDTVRVGVHGQVEGMRLPDDDSPYYRHRPYYTPRISFSDGTEIRYAWEAFDALGIMSYPPQTPDQNGDGVVDASDDGFGYGYYGWGLNPLQLRPDGTDPTKLDDTFARDWFGAIALKTSTTRDGIPISIANHSRCADGAWEDLDGDGVYRCTAMDAPAAGWLNDSAHLYWEQDLGQTYAIPIATLASTGLPDDDIPGGISAWVAGSPTLANPDWDDCTWPHSFVPDRVPVNDTPATYTGTDSLWGDGWRFGAHDVDIRVVLFTDVTRDYCPDGVEP